MPISVIQRTRAIWFLLSLECGNSVVTPTYRPAKKQVRGRRRWIASQGGQRRPCAVPTVKTSAWEGGHASLAHPPVLLQTYLRVLATRNASDGRTRHTDSARACDSSEIISACCAPAAAAPWFGAALVSAVKTPPL